MSSREIVPHSATSALQISEFMHGNEALADPTLRRDYFEHISSTDFIDMVQQMASLVRTGDSTTRQPFDGEKVALMTHEVPFHDDKPALLEETWQTARSFLTDSSIGDEDALEYAALTVAGGILYAHPFTDGNGRTSRLMSFMIGKGEADVDTVEAVTKSLSHEWQVTPASNMPVQEERSYEHEQPQSIQWEFQFAGEAEDALGGGIAGSIYSDLIIREFIERADNTSLALIETCVTRDSDGSMESVNGDKLLEVLVNDPETGIANAQHLLELKYHFQAQYVRNYLKAMRDDTHGNRRIIDDSDLNPYLPEDADAAWSKLYESRRERKEIMSEVIGKRAVEGGIRARDEAVAKHRAFSQFYRRHIS